MITTPLLAGVLVWSAVEAIAVTGVSVVGKRSPRELLLLSLSSFLLAVPGLVFLADFWIRLPAVMETDRYPNLYDYGTFGIAGIGLAVSPPLAYFANRFIRRRYGVTRKDPCLWLNVATWCLSALFWLLIAASV